jgi:hypothetical protein|tara:strand:+ start:600 stop:1172 length:573 start_codon:yes stop_codon:yes gene_type:complete
MSLFPLNPASIDEDIKINHKKNNNKTIKVREPINKVTNLNDIMSNIHNKNNEEEDDDINNFLNTKNNILNKEEFNKQVYENNLGNKLGNNNNNNNLENLNDNSILNENTSYLSNYNNSYKMSYNENSNIDKEIVSNKQLLEKLNYMIYLLEEQHNEKTNHIMEELVLYVFLGIFIIFVLDSFARTGKYLR